MSKLRPVYIETRATPRKLIGFFTLDNINEMKKSDILASFQPYFTVTISSFLFESVSMPAATKKKFSLVKGTGKLEAFLSKDETLKIDTRNMFRLDKKYNALVSAEKSCLAKASFAKLLCEILYCTSVHYSVDAKFVY